MEISEILQLDNDEFKKACLRKKKYELNKIFIRLAEQGSNNLLIWMAHEWHFNLNKAIWAACHHHKIDTMNILYGMGAKLGAGYFVSAVLKNWVDMAMWLYTMDKASIDEYMKTDWFYLLTIVCNNRQIAMLEWLLEKYNVDKDALIKICIHDEVKRFLGSSHQ